MPRRKTPRVVWCVLAVVLIVGAWLRFVRLSERGLLFFDEGVYVLAGRFLYGWWLQLTHHGWTAAQTYLAQADQWTGVPLATANPVHRLTVWLSMLAAGGTDPYAVLPINALCSTLSLALVFAVGRRCFDAWVGVVASAMLAVSAYHLAYARSALADTGATLWLLLAFGVLVSGPAWRVAPSWRRAVVSGLCGGVAFLSSCRLWMIPACLWLVAIMRLQGEGAWTRRRCATQLACLTVGFVAPILVWIGMEAVVLPGLPVPRYPQELVLRYLKHATGWTLREWYAYPYLLAAFDGWYLAGAYGVGLAVLLWQRGWAGRSVALVSLMIIVPFSVVHQHLARYIAVTLPLLALAGAWLLVSSVRWLVQRCGGARLQPLALTALTVGVLCWRLPDAVAITRQTTGYVQTLRVLATLHDGRRQQFVTTQPFIFGALCGWFPFIPPATEEQLQAQLAQGARFFVADYQIAFGGLGTRSGHMAQHLASQLSPVVVPNPAGAAPQVEFEHVTNMQETRRRLADPAARAAMGQIAIYDLWQLPSRSGADHTTEALR